MSSEIRKVQVAEGVTVTPPTDLAITSVLPQGSVFIGNMAGTAAPVATTNGTSGGRIQAFHTTQTGTISNASPGVVTSAGHGLVNGNAIYLTTTGTLPTGLSPNVTYFVVNVGASTFELSTAYGGASINTSSAGSGTHTWAQTGLEPKPLSIGNADIAAGAAIAGTKIVAAASGVTGVVNTVSQEITGIKTFLTGAKIKGEALGADTEAAGYDGYIGEIVQGHITGSNSLTSNSYQDLTSVLLTVGTWDVYYSGHFTRNASSISNNFWIAGLSATAGDTPTPNNRADIRQISSNAVSATFTEFTLSGYARVVSNGTDLTFGGQTTAGTQTLRLKVGGAGFTGNSPFAYGSLVARRVI